jgi:hypothetical protein
VADRRARPALTGRGLGRFASTRLGPAGGDETPYHAAKQVTAGDSPDPTWWLVWGVITGPVSVSLADGTDVPIVTCGPLWAGEWVSLPTQAFVTYAGSRHLVLRHLRPAHLPQAPFPTALAGQSRSSDGGHAWFSFGRPPPGAIDISRRGDE